DLPAPVQYPAAASLGNRLLLTGGLDQATTSLADVVSVDPAGAHRIEALPYAIHDAAGATLRGTAYLLGVGSRPIATSSPLAGTGVSGWRVACRSAPPTWPLRCSVALCMVATRGLCRSTLSSRGRARGVSWGGCLI